MHSPVIERLIEKFEQLPGVGRKSAERISFYILERMSKDEAQSMASVITEAKEKIHLCEHCQNLTDESPCAICSSQKRDRSVICVVETPRDATAVENTHEFKGVYHVLHGAISPLNDIGPDNLTIKQLIARLGNDTVKEVIMATNPTVEGDATALYISKLLKPMGVKVTRLAYGIPVGGDLEYADEYTLAKALEGRNEI